MGKRETDTDRQTDRTDSQTDRLKHKIIRNQQTKLRCITIELKSNAIMLQGKGKRKRAVCTYRLFFL